MSLKFSEYEHPQLKFSLSDRVNPETLVVKVEHERESEHDSSSYKKGFWTGKEHLEYFLFVYHNFEEMDDVCVRRSLQLFKMMSEFI